MEPGLLFDLTLQRLEDRLIQLDAACRHAPLAVVSPPYEQDAAVLVMYQATHSRSQQDPLAGQLPELTYVRLFVGQSHRVLGNRPAETVEQFA